MSNYFAHPSSVIDKGSMIGDGCKIWHFSHIMELAHLGENCNIGQNVVVSPGVKLGRNVKVQNNVSIYSGVICEDNVFLGPSVVFTNVLNPRSEVNQRDNYLKTLVKEGATLGANSTILCGITLGKYSFIGAGSVITKDVPDYALIVGNPGKQTGWMSEKGQKLEFISETAICSASGEEYKLEQGKVSKTSQL